MPVLDAVELLLLILRFHREVVDALAERER